MGSEVIALEGHNLEVLLKGAPGKAQNMARLPGMKPISKNTRYHRCGWWKNRKSIMKTRKYNVLWCKGAVVLVTCWMYATPTRRTILTNDGWKNVRGEGSDAVGIRIGGTQ
jgi:hypothetical protein